jgi:hypothetical protein
MTDKKAPSKIMDKKHHLENIPELPAAPAPKKKSSIFLDPGRIYVAELKEITQDCVLCAFDESLTWEQRDVYSGHSVWFNAVTLKPYAVGNTKEASWSHAIRATFDDFGRLYVIREKRRTQHRFWLSEAPNSNKSTA